MDQDKAPKPAARKPREAPVPMPRTKIPQAPPEDTTFLQTLKNTSKLARDKVNSSVIEGRKHFNSLRKKKTPSQSPTPSSEDRTVSMPPTDTIFFESIHFHSPLQEQPTYGNLAFEAETASEECVYSVPSKNSSQRAIDNAHIILEEKETSYYGTLADSVTEVKKPDPVPELLQPTLPRPNKKDGTYENWSLPSWTPESRRPTKSVIDQFDPLKNNSPNEPLVDDMSFLETLLAGDNYGTLSILNDRGASDDSECEFFWENKDSFTSPPTPPERFDSLQKSDFCSTNPNQESPDDLPLDLQPINLNHEAPSNPFRKTNWFFDAEVAVTSELHQKQQVNNVRNRFSNMLKLVPDSASFLKKKIEQSMESHSIPDKLVIPQTMQQHRGLMVRLFAGGMEEIFKNFQPRLCVLADQKLMFYNDSTTSVAKEIYQLKNIFSLQIIMSHKFNFDGELHCFQINYANSGAFKTNTTFVVFGCTNEGERSSWVHSIIESLSNAFPIECVSGFSRFGWCHLKEGVSGSWEAAWLLLRKRSLHYCINQDRKIHNMDLKKARFVVLQDVEDKKDLPGDDKTLLLIDFPETTLYLQFGSTQETTMWRKIVKKSALNNGACIHHQQLTKENVPTLVDKCINFIYAHGSASEGIYRKTGTSSMITSLLAAFHQDSWAVQLSKNDYSEHDVASALKRFFRDLPEAILTVKLHEQLCAAVGMEDKYDKIAAYKELISTLHPVSFETLKKLIAHLYFIQSMQELNKMNASNLAAVWGPTLMFCPDSVETQWSRKETAVILDLIELYEHIYEPSEEEKKKEKLMLNVLKKYHQSNEPMTKKRSGDFQVWIYLHEKSSENCVSVMINPNKTCADICEELSEKMKKQPHALVIEEVIAGEKMYRPLHHTEKLLNVVLRWSYWEDMDRKDNYLVIKENLFLTMVAARIIPPMNPTFLSMDLKFASNKQKSFKSYPFQFTQAKIAYSKDKNGINILGSWPVEEIRWYIGYESKRNPQSKWSLTFIDRNAKALRTKETPYFGFTMGGNNEEDLIKWIAAFLYAEYPDGIIPVPRLIRT